MSAQTTEIPVVEVHNAWAVYQPQRAGQTPLAELSRPQDWGDPRWHFEQFRFEWVLEHEPGKPVRYVNHAYCWAEAKLERWEYPGYFASLIVQILSPGRPAQICGRQYLAEDDFWQKSWGPRPPLFSRAQEYEAMNL